MGEGRERGGEGRKGESGDEKEKGEKLKHNDPHVNSSKYVHMHNNLKQTNKHERSTWSKHTDSP